MNEFAHWVERTLAQPHAIARSHAANGGKVVGYVGTHVPVELILAADALPLRLYGQGDMPTPLADRYLERAFMPTVRCIAEQWLAGGLDYLHAIVMPRTDDSAQRLYYYLCEFQRSRNGTGPQPLIYDLASIERDSSRRYCQESTRHLAAQLGCHEHRFATACQRVAARSALLAQLQTSSAQSRPPAGSAIHRIVRASELNWSTDFDAALASAHGNIERVTSSSRIALLGSAPPDDRLHRAVEQAGGTVVADCSIDVGDYSTDSGVTLEAISERYYRRALASRTANSPAALLERIKLKRAEAAIAWLIEEDEGILWTLPDQVRALRDAGIPVLALTRQRWSAGAATLAAITDFVGSASVSA